LLKDLAAQTHRRIASAPNGLILTPISIEPVAPVEPSQPADEDGVEDQTIQVVDAQQPARPPKPRTTRGDVPASREPKFPRKYKTLASIFFNGSVQGQILTFIERA
jgi:hypothetical protein